MTTQAAAQLDAMKDRIEELYAEDPDAIRTAADANGVDWKYWETKGGLDGLFNNLARAVLA